MPIRNVYRTLGTMLGYEITKRYGEEGLPDDTIDMTFHGAGGQSIGAFIPRGETIRVYGEVNDYAGKGLSGGRMVVRPEDGITFDPHENVIAGNVTGFGATSGQMFVAAAQAKATRKISVSPCWSIPRPMCRRRSSKSMACSSRPFM